MAAEFDELYKSNLVLRPFGILPGGLIHFTAVQDHTDRRNIVHLRVNSDLEEVYYYGINHVVDFSVDTAVKARSSQGLLNTSNSMIITNNLDQFIGIVDSQAIHVEHECGITEQLYLNFVWNTSNNNFDVKVWHSEKAKAVIQGWENSTAVSITFRDEVPAFTRLCALFAGLRLLYSLYKYHQHSISMAILSLNRGMACIPIMGEHLTSLQRVVMRVVGAGSIGYKYVSISNPATNEVRLVVITCKMDPSFRVAVNYCNQFGSIVFRSNGSYKGQINQIVQFILISPEDMYQGTFEEGYYLSKYRVRQMDERSVANSSDLCRIFLSGEIRPSAIIKEGSDKSSLVIDFTNSSLVERLRRMVIIRATYILLQSKAMTQRGLPALDNYPFSERTASSC